LPSLSASPLFVLISDTQLIVSIILEAAVAVMATIAALLAVWGSAL
jgi:hypothetical protein